jgi:hypothetical protein
MRPVVNGLEREFPGLRLVVLDYNVQADLRVARRLNADYHPAFVFVRPDGSVQRVVIGFQTAEQIRGNVAAFLREVQ